MQDYYLSETAEDTRLTRSAHGRLEFLRTQELVRRHPIGPVVLDIGGATGIHARWLAADGHQVHVIDPVPLHIAAASRIRGITAEVGDARSLTQPDSSVDTVMLMGPLYHLTDHAERQLALAEARRVLRPGGLLFAAAISRYMVILEAGTTARFTPNLTPSLATARETGHYNADFGFVNAYFHTAEELREELQGAGLQRVEVYGVEGPAWPALDMTENADPLMDSALACARMLEQDPRMINASAHFLAVASNPH